MSEVRLPEPVPAIAVAEEHFRADNVPGSFFLEDQGGGEFWFWYRCPCGCGYRAPLNVGKNFKPSDTPSWTWNGSLSAPTLHPSVWHRGHWHGWLKDGIWHNA